MTVAAWARRVARRIRGEDLVESSEARLKEAVADSAKNELGRVRVLEDATRRRMELFREHGWREDEALERRAASELAERRARIEGGDELLGLVGIEDPEARGGSR